MRLIVIIALAVLTGCAMPERPTVPDSKLKPINSVATAEMLTYRAGMVIVGPTRADMQSKQALLYQGGGLRNRPTLRERVFNRPTDSTTLAEVPKVRGAELVPRTVSVMFGFGSALFEPTGEQRWRIRQLHVVADRVIVMGRTDGVGNTDADEKTAQRRAMAAKRYLIELGVPADIISVNYVQGGDYTSDNTTRKGRKLNRRVDIEFVVNDFTKGA